MKNLLRKLPGLPRRLSCFGEGESEVNQVTEDSNTPAYSYDENEWARQQAEFKAIFDNPAQPVQFQPEKAEMYAYGAGTQPAPASTGFWAEAKQVANIPFEYTVTSGEEYGTVTPAPAPSPTIQAVAPKKPQVSVQPSTTNQVLNLVNTVAEGLLDVQKTNAQTKLSVAQINALAEASKVQAQNYVQQQLQAGKSVLVPQEWLSAYSQSGTWTKWLTPILVIGGVGLLAFVAYKYMQKKKAVAANPKFSGKGSRAKTAQVIAEVKALAERVIDAQPDYAFGHGYLWGIVAGKKTLISGIYGKTNHDLIQREVEKHPAVESTWINLD